MTDTRAMPDAQWKASVWAAFRDRRLTRTARDVLLCLAGYQRGPGGHVWPSHDTLAARARCCRKTVLRAVAQAKAAGLLDWRPIRWLTPAGWRRKSNLYSLRLPLRGSNVPQKEKAKKDKGLEARTVEQQLAKLGGNKPIESLAQIAERRVRVLMGGGASATPREGVWKALRL